jgi:hypothetical protein
MGLSISHTDIQLGMERTPSKLNIETQKARLDLYPTYAKLDMRTDPPRITIDQYECRASEGLKNNYDLLQEASQMAYQHILEYIGQTAEDGDRLAAIQYGGNPIGEIAKRDANGPQHEFGIGFIPKARPEIGVTGSIQIEPVLDENGATNAIKSEYTPGSVSYSYDPARINIYVKQYPSVNIQYEGSNIDSQI